MLQSNSFKETFSSVCITSVRELAAFSPRDFLIIIKHSEPQGAISLLYLIK